MIPNEEKIRKALLIELYGSENHAALPKNIYDNLAVYFDKELDDEDLEKYRNSKSKFANTIQWTRTHLINEGYIFSPDKHKRNEWKLTDIGIKLGRETAISEFGYDLWEEVANTLEPISENLNNKLEPQSEELSFPEGQLKYALHAIKERNKKLVALKKQIALDKNPLLPCEICNISFNKMYGEVGDGFIEAHHVIPISELTEETSTKLEDLVLVCSNCHKMIHRKRPWLTIENMTTLLIRNQ